MKMRPEAVVFDIGNVLIEWQPERFYDAQIGPERRAEMFGAVDLHAMNDRVDTGNPFRETIYETAAAHPEWRPEIEMWHDRWIEMATPVISHSLRLMEALQAKGIPVFSLTNFGIQSYDLAARHYPFLRRFDRDFISGHIGTMEGLLDKLGSGAWQAKKARLKERIRQVAERLIRVAAERALRTHHFESPRGWADRLVEEGLLTTAEAR